MNLQQNRAFFVFIQGLNVTCWSNNKR